MCTAIGENPCGLIRIAAISATVETAAAAKLEGLADNLPTVRPKCSN